LLGLLPAATAAVCRALRQYAARHRQAALLPAPSQGLRSELGIAVVPAGVGVFTALAALLPARTESRRRRDGDASC